VEFRIAPAGRTTGLLLQELVGPNQTDAVVCYGSPYSGSLPALNANTGRFDKFEQGVELLRGLGAHALPCYTYEQAMAWLIDGGRCLLGRKLRHTQGRDIIPILERWQLEASRGICDFYTPYVSSVGEYRTWVYRNRHLGSYKKELAHSEQYQRLGRNYRNGFIFSRVENDAVPESIKTLAKSAVRTLGLDFGAVDLLDLGDAGYMVLEVNSAPGVAHERRAVINNLAHRIQRWAANGCPGRSHAE